MTNFPLPVYNLLSRQHIYKPYAYGKAFVVYEQKGFLPTFQINRRENVGADFTVTLVRIEDGSEVDITSEAQASGFVIIPNDADQDEISSNSTLILAGSYEIGFYYLKISDGVNEWITDWFQWLDDLSDFVKIEYWHSSDILRDRDQSVSIRYVAPFKCRTYWPSRVGKPRRLYTEEVETVKGRNFPIHQVTWKQYRFDLRLNEELSDALALIRLHDVVRITYDGEVYEVDEFIFPDPDWSIHGDTAALRIEFKTDTVFVVNGRGLSGVDYEPTAGSCIAVDHTAKALVEDGSANYLAFEFVDENGDTQSLEAGDKIVKVAGSNLTVEEYNGASYDSVSVSAGNVVYVEADGVYYGGIGSNSIAIPGPLFYSEPFLAGSWLNGAQHSIYAITGEGEVFVGQYSYEYMTDEGGEVEFPEGTERIRVEFGSALCGTFQSAEYELPNPVSDQGVGFDIIGSTLKVY